MSRLNLNESSLPRVGKRNIVGVVFKNIINKFMLFYLGVKVRQYNDTINGYLDSSVVATLIILLLMRDFFVKCYVSIYKTVTPKRFCRFYFGKIRENVFIDINQKNCNLLLDNYIKILRP